MNTSSSAAIVIRRISQVEWPQAFSVISELRKLEEADFLRRVLRQSYSGYELIGAFRAGKLIGVLGMRPVHTLARGAYLHVDDLVVATDARGSGAGHALMEYAEADARAREMSAIFLDARPEAVAFYESRKFVLHPAPSMKKLI